MGVATTARLVFEARGLSKVYRTGEVDVVALRHVEVIRHPTDRVADGVRVRPRP